MSAQKGNAHGEVGAQGTSRNTTQSYHNITSNFLDHLQKVRRTGPGRWVACCPAHDDKSPSLAIREAEDGRLLVHCFSGCSVQEVVTALGLELSDLFPPRSENHRPEARPFPAMDVLKACAFEVSVAVCAIAMFLDGRPFGQDEYDRLAVACGRLQNALDAGRLI